MSRTLPRNVLFALAVAVATGTGACVDSPTEPRTVPVLPEGSPPPPSNSQSANYAADATVLAAGGSGQPCGWGTVVGDTRAAVGWRVAVVGESISLDEDMDNWPMDHIPFAGTLRGQSFEAHYQSAPDYLRYECQFREASLTGTFTADFATFEAHEVLFWGPPDNEARVERVWRGRRL